MADGRGLKGAAKCSNVLRLKASTIMASITRGSAFRANSPNCFNAEEMSAFVRLQAGNGTHSANGFFSFSTKAIFLQSRSGICTFEEQFITVETHNMQTPKAATRQVITTSRCLKQTFTIGSLKSSGSNMSDLEQILSEPLTFLEGKQNFINRVN